MTSIAPDGGSIRPEDELDAWRHVVEQVAFGIAIGSADGRRLEHVNPAFARMHGYTVEELTGRPITDVFAPEARTDVARNIAIAHERGHHVFESTHVRRDGSTFPVRLDVTAVRGADGEARYRVVHMLDLTEQKRTDAVLRRQGAIAAHLAEGLVVVGASDGTITYMNAAAERMFGYSPGELVGKPVTLLNAPTDADPEELAATVRAHLERDGVWSGENAYARKDGSMLTCRINISTFDDPEDGRFWLGVFTDITARKRTETALRESETRFRTVFEEGPVGMAIIDADLRVSRVNDALCALLETDRSKLVGRHLAERVPPEDAGRIVELAQQLFARRLQRVRVEQRFVTAHGRRTGWAQLSGSFVPGGEGLRPYVIVMIEDITARKEAEELLFHRAWYDQLTGLPNRALLADHLQQALSRSERTLEHLAVLFVDLDGFKGVNDTFGHDAGDAVLVEQAHRIAGCLRPSDTAARHGGDEFVVLLSPLNRHRSIAEAEAMRIAERVERALVRPIPIRRRKAVVSGSIGVVVASAEGGSPEMLIRAADDAMYEAKASGRGRYALRN